MESSRALLHMPVRGAMNRMARKRVNEHSYYTTSEDSSSDEYSWEGNGYSTRCKRFLSEEMMAAHMRQLYLATPHHYSSVGIDTHNTAQEHSLILQEPTIHASLMLPPQETLIQAHNFSVPNSLNPKIHDDTQMKPHPDQQEVVMEDDITDDSDSSDNESHAGLQVWIAPEMERIMKKNSPKDSLPDKILEDLHSSCSRSCQALVPYVDTEVKLAHSVWKHSKGHSDNNPSHEEQVVTPLVESTTASYVEDSAMDL